MQVMMQRRRKRFIITVKHLDKRPIQRVCLAYSAETARLYMERDPDITVVSIKPAKRRKYMQGVAARWEVDDYQLARACRMLDIRWPIKITRTSSTVHRGQHRVGCKREANDPIHYITVEKTATLRQASKTLWHELAHAMQSERHVRQLEDEGNVFAEPHEKCQVWVSATQRRHKIRYAERPHEIEAKEIESIFTKLLTKPAR
jgi:hypothetical protein